MKARLFFRHLREEWAVDRIDDVAAMMTYYAVFALFPMLAFVVTIAVWVVPAEWIGSAVEMASSAMPGDVAQMLADQVARMETAAGAGFAIGGAVIALWGASRGASALMNALNDMFEKRETRPWWKRQLVAIGVTLVVSTLLIVAMALLAAGPAIGGAVAARFDLGVAFEVGFAIVRWALAALFVMLVWAILYRWLPDTHAPFRIFTPGAIAGVLLWFGITQAFALYLDRFAGYEQTYGAVASVIVFLTWLWLSNLALLIGAEINDVLAEMRKHDSPAAADLAEQEKAPNEKGNAAAGLRPRPSAGTAAQP